MYKRPLLLSVLILCSVLMLRTNAYADNKVLDATQNLPDFSLQNQYGEVFHKTDFVGQWSLLFIGFTTCPDVCPMTLANLEAVRADLGLRLSPKNIPNIVFLAVDPERDKAFLKDYLNYFHPKYVGITGDTNEIDKLVKGIGAFYRIKKKFEGDKNYEVLHTSTVYVINPDGKVAATISPPFKAVSTGEFLNHLIRTGH